MNKGKNILVSPLNWGLGHASRLIPIITYLKEEGCNVIIGGSGNSIELLKNYFPELLFVNIPSSSLIYGKKKSFSLKFYFSFLSFILSIFKEHNVLNRLVNKYDVDLVISDNRLGLYNKKIKSIYISHQLNIYIKNNQLQKSHIATYIHRRFIKKYDCCIVPDIISREESLSGRLTADVNDLNTKFVGPISRFEKTNIDNNVNKEFDFICILSGPEPQRTIFENILISMFLNTKYKVVIIRGLPNNPEIKQNTPEIRFINHIDDEQLLSYISLSKKIICRSGYSSVMDLAHIGRRAILVSTPEQPEQEYIAYRLNKYHGFVKVDQKNLKSTNIDNLKYEDLWNFKHESESLKKIINLYL